MNTDTTTTQHPIIVIHHSADFDGLFCREIARRNFGARAEYIGWDYGLPEPVVPAEAELYLLDISVPGLMEHPRLTWIDHHQSAMEKYGVKPGLQIDGVAACRLAWQFFAFDWKGCEDEIPNKDRFVSRNVCEPWSVRLAGEYDILDKRDADAELFQHGLRAQELTPELWRQILQYDRRCTIAELEAAMDAGFSTLINPNGTRPNPTVVALLESGKAVAYAKEQENADVITSYGFDVVWEGLCFLACNHPRFNSHLFTAGLQPHHQALLGFKWDGKLGRWRVSLYHAPGHTQHDLSQIAVKYGGGGHRGACGFEMEKLPFLP